MMAEDIFKKTGNSPAIALMTLFAVLFILRLAFVIWFGGYTTLIEFPILFLLLLGLYRRLLLAYVLGAILFCLMGLLFLASFFVTFSHDYLEKRIPDVSIEYIILIRLMFMALTTGYLAGAAICARASAQVLCMGIFRKNSIHKIICLLVGARFVKIQEIKLCGSPLKVAVFDPAWKRTPFYEPLSGMIYVPSFFLDPAGMTEFNKIVLLHEMGHQRQPMFFNLPRDMVKYLTYILLVMAFTLIMIFFSDGLKNTHMLHAAAELFTLFLALRILSAPLNWICEADAEAYAISRIGEGSYLKAVESFYSRQKPFAGLLQRSLTLFERLPWRMQYRLIKALGMLKSE